MKKQIFQTFLFAAFFLSFSLTGNAQKLFNDTMLFRIVIPKALAIDGDFGPAIVKVKSPEEGWTDLRSWNDTMLFRSNPPVQLIVSADSGGQDSFSKGKRFKNLALASREGLMLKFEKVIIRGTREENGYLIISMTNAKTSFSVVE